MNDNDSASSSEEVTRVGGGFSFPLTVGSGSGCDGAHLCSWSGDAASRTTNRQQGTVQAFYLANRFHDHLAALGFTAANGAFENGDRLQLNTFDGASTGPDANHVNNANMYTPPDGTSPLMQMYLFKNPSFRNGMSGDDADVLFHEYTHGLSNRLITDAAGAGALNSAQAGAMGEAWSDWYAQDYIVDEFPSLDTSFAGEVSMGAYFDFNGGSGAAAHRAARLPGRRRSDRLPGARAASARAGTPTATSGASAGRPRCTRTARSGRRRCGTCGRRSGPRAPRR